MQQTADHLDTVRGVGGSDLNQSHDGIHMAQRAPSAGFTVALV